MRKLVNLSVTKSGMDKTETPNVNSIDGIIRQKSVASSIIPWLNTLAPATLWQELHCRGLKFVKKVLMNVR